MQPKWSATVLVGVLVLCAPAPALAENREVIGTLVTTQGVVSVRNANGEEQRIQRRGQLFAGDTLVVGLRGFASVRMVDNAHLSLGANTEFTFDTYRYDANPATRDSVVMRLERGCFRTVIGSATASKRDEYRIDTPVASIRIDGAFHAAAFVRDALYTGTWDGSTVIANAAGSVRLGEYGDFGYSRTYANTAPEGFAGLPPELTCEPPKSLDRELADDD